MERVFNRRVQFDERSRSFPIAETLPTKKLRSYTWPCSTYNDQGNEGACVGFAWGHELCAVPFAYPVDKIVSQQIYKSAQDKDIWPGDNYSGTSCLAGAKAVQAMVNSKGEPLIGEYRFGFGLEDLARGVGSTGPAILGINWYSDMSLVDRYGYIHKTGFVQGGHAILCKGVKIIMISPRLDRTNFLLVDKLKSYFILHNSWGPGWGVGGSCKINFQDMENLLHEQGESIFPLKRSK